MMPKYITKASWDDYEDGMTAKDIIVEDERPEDTGLLDSQGYKLYRVKDKVPIGFRIK